MFGADRSVVAAVESEDWHPRYWTLACVGAFHLVFAATLLTTPPFQPPPPILNTVDVVTFPDGVSTPTPPQSDAPVVELKQTQIDETLPVPKPDLDPVLGPKPSDRRTKDILPDAAEPSPLLPPVQATPAPTPPALTPPAVMPAAPAPQPLPLPTKLPIPIIASPTARDASAAILPPPQVEPLQSSPVLIRPVPASPSLMQPDAQPLSITGSKLALKQAATLKPTRRADLPAPPAPSVVAASPQTPPLAGAATAQNIPAPSTVLPPARTASPPPPAFAAPQTAPLAILRAQTALPKVQVPRIAASDLRLPEVPASGGLAAAAPSPMTPSGVTSVSGALPRSSGGGAAGQGGAATSGSGGNAAPRAGDLGGGTRAAGGESGAQGPNSAASDSDGGPSGMLPRRPGGASVREAFPRGDSSTILGKMDKTYDCSRLNRERDARCPSWDPIEGRNGQGAAGFEVAVPKGLPKLRNPIGTNPLPVCPAGTPGNQMGLSCLPSREGPGIPRP